MPKLFKVLSFLCDEITTDILVSELSKNGFDSFLITDTGFEASVSLNDFNEEVLIEIVKTYSLLGPVKFHSGEIREKNWNVEWEKNFQPIIVNDQCAVRASFHKLNKKYPIEMIINPKMSFGTGHHETTFLMIQSQLNTDHKNKSVLDAGCGTGILSILAEKLGAEKITGFDVDHWAFENAWENINLNHCNKIEIIEGKIEKISKQFTYDIILANINLNVIVEELKSYYEILSPGGLMILSGFLIRDLKALIESTKSLNLSLIEKNSRNKWLSLIVKKDQ